MPDPDQIEQVGSGTGLARRVRQGRPGSSPEASREAATEGQSMRDLLLLICCRNRHIDLPPLFSIVCDAFLSRTGSP